MDSVVSLFASGFLIGASGAVSPGPMMTLVISQTLKHGKWEGIKVAFAPIITDVPIGLMAIFIVNQLSHINILLGITSAVGACFLLFLAWENFQVKEFSVDVAKIQPKSLQKGIITNFLNPFPYVFWFTVVAPLVVKSPIIGAILYLAGMYGAVVGIKIIIALIIDKSRTIFKSKIYIYTVRLLGLTLVYFALEFFVKALHLFGFL